MTKFTVMMTLVTFWNLVDVKFSLENFSNSNHDFFRQRGAKAESGTVPSLNLKDFLKSTLFGLLSQKSHSRKISTEFWNYALRGM